MPRRKNCRKLYGPPCCSGFKPRGIPSKHLNKVNLTLDEYEAIRLADHLNLEHIDASEKMGVSRSIFTRLVKGARVKVAKALIEGCELVIDGGEYHFERKFFKCGNCNHIIDLEIESKTPLKCPKCESPNLTNINKQFGMKGQCKRHGLGLEKQG